MFFLGIMLLVFISKLKLRQTMIRKNMFIGFRVIVVFIPSNQFLNFDIHVTD